MLITQEIIGTALISVVVTYTIGYITFRVKLESRIKDMEHKLELLNPVTKILMEKGSEQVEKVFRGRNR